MNLFCSFMRKASLINPIALLLRQLMQHSSLGMEKRMGSHTGLLKTGLKTMQFCRINSSIFIPLYIAGVDTGGLTGT